MNVKETELLGEPANILRLKYITDSLDTKSHLYLK
jgi:hypothetical protein